MKRTALILAAATAFDLGVMTVGTQAQQFGDVPTPKIGVGSTMGGILPGLAVQDPTGTGGCTPGSPLTSGTANPCAPRALASDPRDGKHFPVIHIKIDRVNTSQACTARGGKVVPHEGVQQCRISNPAAPAIGNPRTSGIPPRN